MTSKYTRERLEEAVQASTSVSQVLRYLGVAVSGGMHRHIKQKIAQFDISTEHFTGKGWARGFTSNQKRSPDDILVQIETPYRAKTYHLRRALLEIGRSYQCQACGLGPVWNGQPLILEIDHINGSWRDCRRENLRFLCPNCHAQASMRGSPSGEGHTPTPC